MYLNVVGKTCASSIRGERTRHRVLFPAPTPETKLEPAGWHEPRSQRVTEPCFQPPGGEGAARNTRGRVCSPPLRRRSAHNFQYPAAIGRSRTGNIILQCLPHRHPAATPRPRPRPHRPPVVSTSPSGAVHITPQRSHIALRRRHIARLWSHLMLRRSPHRNPAPPVCPTH